MKCPICHGNKKLEGDGYIVHNCYNCHGSGCITDEVNFEIKPTEIKVVEKTNEETKTNESIDVPKKRGRKPRIN